ncbi:hypothetical protein BsWGS_17934 [Bradybaena similaris]
MSQGWTVLLIVGFCIAVDGSELPVGLILENNALLEEELYEQAFDFAAMVMNNNLLNEKRDRNERTILEPIMRNKTDLRDNYKLGSAICSVVNDGVIAIIGTSYASTFNTIQSYCQALRVPYILATPSRPSALDGYQYDVSVCPPYVEALMKVTANLTISNNTIFYVYDSDDGLWRLQRIYHYFQMKAITHRMLDAFRIRDIKKAYTLLRNLDMKENEYKTIVLDLSSRQAYKLVLEQVIDVGMNRDNYHYILTGINAMDLGLEQDFFSQFLYGGVEMTAFRFLNNGSDTYKKWEQIWQQHREHYPALFPLKTPSALMIDAVRAIYEVLLMGIPKPASGRPRQKQHCNMESSRPLDTGPAIISALNKVRFQGLTGPVALNQGRRSEYSVDIYKLQFKQQMTKVTTTRLLLLGFTLLNA